MGLENLQQIEEIAETTGERRLLRRATAWVVFALVFLGAGAVAALFYARVQAQVNAVQANLRTHEEKQDQQWKYMQDSLDAIWTDLRVKQDTDFALCMAHPGAHCPPPSGNPR